MKRSKEEFAKIIETDLAMRFFKFTAPERVQLGEAVADSLDRWPNDSELLQRKYEQYRCKECGRFYGCECEKESTPPTNKELVDMFFIIGCLDMNSYYPGGSPVKESLTPDVFKDLTPEQRKQTADWVGAIHFVASDNDDVKVPPKPEFLPAWIKDQFPG